jgi:MYXO-CTERM domain-containing protein
MRPLPRTGIGDLDLKPQQALSTVWPTYDVHVYYDSGKTVTIGGKSSKQLVPMYPFTYFHSHEGALFGFSHGFALSSGAVLKEIRPDVYLITIPSEGSANVVTSVQAHEEPKDPVQPGSCPTCPPPVTGPKPPPPVDKDGHCGCRVPGNTPARGAAAALFGIAALGLAFARRRRAKRV